MFQIDEKGAITMHSGDTGAYKVHAVRDTGDPWTSDDRMLYTVRNGSGAIIMQRIYRLDTELGNGYALIEFHNSDTDTWVRGSYATERRYIINPSWTGDVPDGDVVDALVTESHMVEGDVVRVPPTGQSSITILDVYGVV